MLLKEHQGYSEAFTSNGQSRKISYLTRSDPFSGNVSKISEERAKRTIGISVELQLKQVEHCVFCDYQANTPKERIEHDCGVVSVPNLFPWEKYDWITIYPPYKQHKLFLSDLYFDDLERMMESSYELAGICARDPEVYSFMDFTNWGVFAGASQQHPHSQRKSVSGVPSPGLRNEMQRSREMAEQYGRNPFDILEQEERQDGRRVIHDEDIFIAANFAPACPDEIIVFPKEHFSHVLQMSPEERKRIIKPVLGIFPALFFCRGVTNLNIAVHMASFSEMEEARSYYRWHMHIYPRRDRLPVDKAGAELGFGTTVIDTLPEMTAEKIRTWYQCGPSEDMVAKTSDGCPNPGLLEEFRRHVNRER